jgi:hypothetical protein
VNDIRDLVDERDLSKAEIPQSFKEARKIVKVVAVSSAEVERAFSLMNNMATDKRNSFLVENIYFLTVKLMRKPLAEWDATPFMKSWLCLGHNTAADNRVKKKGGAEYSQHQLALLSLLQFIIGEFCKCIQLCISKLHVAWLFLINF